LEKSARRDFLKIATVGAGMLIPAALEEARGQTAQTSGMPAKSFDVVAFGAKGDGTTIDTPPINHAIEEAAASGGGTIRFGAGQYLCYSIWLKSNVALQLEQGAVIIAADPLPEGQPGGYDKPKPTQPWEAYQDLFHVKTPASAPAMEIHESSDVNALWVRGVKDGKQGLTASRGAEG
jgi:polygalacturonase